MNEVVASTKQKNLQLEQALKSSQQEVEALKQAVAKAKTASPVPSSELRAQHRAERDELKNIIARQQVTPPPKHTHTHTHNNNNNNNNNKRKF